MLLSQLTSTTTSKASNMFLAIQNIIYEITRAKVLELVSSYWG